MILSTFCESSQNSPLNESIKSELDRLREKHGFPGVTCAYVLPDGTIGEVASGYADRETKDPVTPQSRMLAASVGKTFVAATVLALANEGQLNLDDPLSLWLGNASWYPNLPNHETITLRHLLTHRAGLADHAHSSEFLKLARTGIDFSHESLIEFILNRPPLFEPGQGWAYTDTGYILLGLVIEAVTGKTYYDELDCRFLKPFQLKSTTPSDRPILPGLISGYTAQENLFSLPSKKLVDASGSLVFNPAIEWTGGGLISTSRDLAVWAKLLYEGHAMQTEYLSEILKSIPTSNDGSETRYGAGVVIKKCSFGQKWGHLGLIPGYISSMQYYPEYRMAIAFQVNSDENASTVVNDLEETLAEIVIQNIKI
jgi:D-alanyl-D-alanine carboxypeptidase